MGNNRRAMTMLAKLHIQTFLYLALSVTAQAADHTANVKELIVNIENMAMEGHTISSTAKVTAIGPLEIFAAMNSDQLENVHLIGVFGVDRPVILSSNPSVLDLRGILSDSAEWSVAISPGMLEAADYIDSETPSILNSEVLEDRSIILSSLASGEFNYAIVSSSEASEIIDEINPFAVAVVGSARLPFLPGVSATAEMGVPLDWGNPIMWTASGSEWTADEIKRLRGKAANSASGLRASVIEGGLDPLFIVPEAGQAVLNKFMSETAFRMSVQKYWDAVPSCNPI